MAFLAHTEFLKCCLNLKEEILPDKNINLMGLSVLVIAEYIQSLRLGSNFFVFCIFYYVIYKKSLP